MLESSKAHLNEVQEDYWAHLAAALAISARLAKASAACALHALVPGLCTRTASRCIAEVQSSLVKRHQRQPDAHDRRART